MSRMICRHLAVATAIAVTTVALACGENQPAPEAPTASPAPIEPVPAAPVADAGSKAAAAMSELVIVLARGSSGGVVRSIDGRVLAGDADLEGEARRALADAPGIAAVIAPARETPHGEVVRVMDILKSVGIERIAVKVGDPEPGDPTPASGGR